MAGKIESISENLSDYISEVESDVIKVLRKLSDAFKKVNELFKVFSENISEVHQEKYQKLLNKGAK